MQIKKFVLTFGLVLAMTAEIQAKNIIIFTAPYGAGHDQASNKIAELIREQDPETNVVIKNTQDFMPETFKKISLWFFNWAQMQAPDIYSRAFDGYFVNGGEVESIGEMPMTWGMDLRAMQNWIEEQKPFKIISAWPHATEALARLREYGYFREIPIGGVVTDFVSRSNRSDKHSTPVGAKNYFTKLASEVDMAFLPAEKMLQDYIDGGASSDRLMVTGIPLKLDAREPLTMASRNLRVRAARQKLGLPLDRKTIMIEGGRNGVGNYPLIIGSLLQSFQGEPITIIAATGENQKLFSRLNELISPKKSIASQLKLMKAMRGLLKNNIGLAELEQLVARGIANDQAIVKILGFEPLATYREAADLVITKPGGLSTSEMAANGILMILNTGLATGQEEYNVSNFVGAGLAVNGFEEAKMGAVVLETLADQQLFEKFLVASETFRKTNRTDLIASWALSNSQSLYKSQPSSKHRFEKLCRTFFIDFLSAPERLLAKFKSKED